MKYLSVCSGIEAATVAWHPLGWQPVAFSEIDKFPSAVLAHHYPGVPNWGDMTKFEEWPDADVDVLVGGTPCQSFSVAGLRAGLADPRGNLMLTFGAIARRYRPTFVVWENVPGVLSSHGGRDFGTFLGLLGELGYGFAYRVLDAQYFGVPQRRRRVFVIGHLGDWRRAAAVLFERHSLSGHPAPRREAGEKPAGTFNARTSSGGGFGTDFECDGGLIAHTLRGEGFDASEDGTGRGTPLVPVVAPTLRAGGNRTGGDRPPGTDVDTCESLIPVAIRTANTSANGHGIAENVAHTLDQAQGQCVAFAIQAGALRTNPSSGPDGIGVQAEHAYTLEARAEVQAVAFVQNQRDEVRELEVAGALAAEPGMKQQTFIAFSAKDYGADAGEIAPTLRSMGHDGSHANGGGQVAVAFAENSRAELRLQGGDGQIAPQITTGGGKPGQGMPAVMQSMQVRRLTPRECERLQGFPDDYTLIPYRGKPAADGPRYKALGNSMAVPVMRWIGERIQQVAAIEKAA